MHNGQADEQSSGEREAPETVNMTVRVSRELYACLHSEEARATLRRERGIPVSSAEVIRDVIITGARHKLGYR